MQRQMLRFLHRLEGQKTNVVRLAYFVERPADAHVARQPPATIGRALKGSNGGSHGTLRVGESLYSRTAGRGFDTSFGPKPAFRGNGTCRSAAGAIQTPGLPFNRCNLRSLEGLAFGINLHKFTALSTLLVRVVKNDTGNSPQHVDEVELQVRIHIQSSLEVASESFLAFDHAGRDVKNSCGYR